MPPPTAPCAILRDLLAKRLALISGESVKMVEIEGGNGAKRRVERHMPDLQRLDRLILEYQDKCAKACGKMPQRSAIMFR